MATRLGRMPDEATRKRMIAHIASLSSSTHAAMFEPTGSYSIRQFISFMDEVDWRLFERQFEAWWPLHLLMLALGAAIIMLACLGKTRAVAITLAMPFAAALASAQLASGATLIVAANFGGSGVTLDGTTAERMNDPTPKPPR